MEKKGRATPRKDKVEAVEKIKQLFTENDTVIFTKWLGIKSNDMMQLRSKLRKQGAFCKVLKNTLTKRALNEIEKQDLLQFIDGPVMAVFPTGEDKIAAFKEMVELAKEYEELKVIGGYFDGSVIDEAGVKAIATLPSKEQLRAMLLGTLQGVMRNFVNLMNAPQRFVTVLRNKVDKGE